MTPECEKALFEKSGHASLQVHSTCRQMHRILKKPVGNERECTFVCACLCVCVRAREREKVRECVSIRRNLSPEHLGFFELAI